jgi:hypothetical protein
MHQADVVPQRNLLLLSRAHSLKAIFEGVLDTFVRKVDIVVGTTGIDTLQFLDVVKRYTLFFGGHGCSFWGSGTSSRSRSETGELLSEPK